MINIEIKEESRFIVDFLELGIPNYLCSRVSTIYSYKSTYGYTEWASVIFNFYDEENAYVGKIFQKEVFDKDLRIIDKIKIRYINSKGTETGALVLNKSEIESVNFGQFDWSSDRIKEITLMIKPGYVTFE